MTQKIIVSKLASLIIAYKNCIKANNTEWEANHLESIESMCKNLPNGSGIDAGMKLDIDGSTEDKIVFTFSFHHLNANGYYDGWTDHKLTIKPSLIHGLNLYISGKDRNGVKEYLYDIFHEIFTLN